MNKTWRSLGGTPCEAVANAISQSYWAARLFAVAVQKFDQPFPNGRQFNIVWINDGAAIVWRPGVLATESRGFTNALQQEAT